MSFLEDIIYKDKKLKDDEFIVPNGIVYVEKPSFSSLFRKRKSIIRITYKERGAKK